MKRLCVGQMFVSAVLLICVFFFPAFSQASEIEGETQKQRYAELSPEGDYSRLTYKIFTNKKTYKQGEPVFIETMVINDSESPVALCTKAVTSFLGLNHMRVLDENMEEMPWTRHGRQEYKISANGRVGYLRTFLVPYEKLEPGGKCLLGGIQLNAYVDMSLPGKYHITFYRTSFTTGQEYTEPLPSNRVTIEVESERFGSRSLKEPGTYDNDTGDSMKEIEEYKSNKAERELEKIKKIRQMIDGFEKNDGHSPKNKAIGKEETTNQQE